MFQDRTLKCRDCGADFVFSASEQEFFAEKGFTNDPSRCQECRAARKNQNRGGYSNDYRRQERQMYPAVCASCGKDTEVPFQPSGEKPVYCRDCFRQRSSY